MSKEVDRNFIKKWVDLEISKCPQFILDKLDENILRQNFRKEVTLYVSYCDDEAYANKNFGFAKIEGSSAEDYKYRLLRTPFGQILTSIRFVGGDLNKPSVFILYKDFELNIVEEIKQIGQLLNKEYSVFQPQRIRWYSPNIERELIENNEFISGDLIYVCEFIDHLKAQMLPGRFEEVQLKGSTELGWYDRYKIAYEKIYKQRPSFKEMAVPESKSTLQLLMQQKLLFEVFVQNKWAGIIAANKSSKYFLSGFEIYEELLLEQYRGKQFGPAIQRHLIERLSVSKGDMLFGTIHYRNVPSLKTAYRVGRKPIGMFVFAKIV